MQQAILDQARLAFRSGDFARAKSLSLTALTSELPDHVRSQLFFLLFECYRIKGDNSKATQLLDDAPRFVTSAENGQLHIQMHQGYLLGAQGRFAEALTILTDAEKKARDCADEILPDVRLRKAMVYFFANNLNASEKLYRLVLDETKRTGDEDTRILALAGIGKNHMARGKFQPAIEWFSEALEAASNSGQTYLAATMKSELGWCFYNLDENDRALELFRAAESVFGASGARHNYGIALANIGNVYFKQGQYPAAIDYYQRALEIAREINDKVSIAKWLKNLSVVYSRTQDAETASKYDLEAMQAKLDVERERLRAKQST